MALTGIANPAAAPPPPPADQQQLTPEMKERLFVLSLEFSRRAVEARSFEELCYIMTNDIRALIEFDRCSLVTHMLGRSTFVGASNQPVLDGKSKFNDELARLGEYLKGLDRAVLFKNPSEIDALADDVVPPELKQALNDYVRFAKCTGMLCVPLKYGDEIVGHLLMEYLDGGSPGQPQTVALVRLAPFFASSLAQKWILTQNPELLPLTEVHLWHKRPTLEFLRRHVAVLTAGIVLVVAVLFFLPLSYPVGGEAEVAPRDRVLAFSGIDGLIDRIDIVEGSTVEKGQVIATLDPTDLEFRIQATMRQIELLTAEMTLLKRSSGQDVAKLAESKLVELKLKGVVGDLQYLQWQRQYLQITAPVSGIVVTKHVETLVGKKFKAGEPFCEIAVPGDLRAEIFVSEDKVSRLSPGQEGELYLNNEPLKGYLLRVQEVAPRAEIIPRLGNVYRVKAAFIGDQPPPVKVGMKGVATISTERTNLYTIITQRLYARWNQFVLYFI